MTHLGHRSHAQLVLIDAESGEANPNEGENEQDRQENLDARRDLQQRQKSDGTSEKSRVDETGDTQLCERIVMVRNTQSQQRMV